MDPVEAQPRESAESQKVEREDQGGHLLSYLNLSDVSEAATRRIVRAAVARGTERSGFWIAGAGLASLALYRSLAELGDLRAHLTAYLAIHTMLFAIYAGVVFLLAARGLARPPRTSR